MRVLPAGWSQAWEALRGIDFPGRTVWLSPNISVSINTHYPTWGRRDVYPVRERSSGKQGQKKNEGREQGSRKEGKFRGRGAQEWAGSGGEVRGPRHESSFVAAAPGSPELQRAASRGGHWPWPYRHWHFDLSSLASEPNKSGCGCPGPSRTPVPRPPAGRVSPCGLQPQRCWPGGAAGRWGRAGRSPLRSGGGPLRAPPGKPEADERRCPLLGLGATRGRRQKRVRGGESHRTPWPRPTPRDAGARSPRGRHGISKTGRPGHRSPELTQGLGSGRCKVRSGPVREFATPRAPRWARLGGPRCRRRRPGAGWARRPGRLRLSEPGRWEARNPPRPAGSESSPRAARGPRATMSGARPARRPPGSRRGADFVRGPAGSGRPRHEGWPWPGGGRRGPAGPSLPVG